MQKLMQKKYISGFILRKRLTAKDCGDCKPKESLYSYTFHIENFLKRQKEIYFFFQQFLKKFAIVF
jgi:hypothetical protein